MTSFVALIMSDNPRDLPFVIHYLGQIQKLQLRNNTLQLTDNTANQDLNQPKPEQEVDTGVDENDSINLPTR